MKAIATAALALALAGCSSREDGMTPMMKAATGGLPPIDAATPAATSTATFATG